MSSTGQDYILVLLDCCQSNARRQRRNRLAAMGASRALESFHEDVSGDRRHCALSCAVRRRAMLSQWTCQKTNPMKVYMHYMPWFETPATLGGTNWGYHWKMNNQESEHRRRQRQAADRVALLSQDRPLSVERSRRHRISPAADEVLGRRRRDDRLVRRAGHERRHQSPAHQLERDRRSESTTSGSISAS